MFTKFLQLKPTRIFIIYLMLDAICIGMGMGVPIFCILFGFPVGWFLARYSLINNPPLLQVMRKIFKYSSLTAGFTMLAMLLLWGPTISILFDPSRDLSNFGIPMILYEPKASFIGWLVLMIVISPFLQLLTTVFGSYIVLLKRDEPAIKFSQSE